MSVDEVEPIEAEAADENAVAPQGTHLASTQTITHEYLTQSGKVMRETIKTNQTVTAVLDFIYDESGKPFAMIDQLSAQPKTYYYVLNLQGDVVKLVTDSGAVAASYEYDAWGNILASSGSMAEKNPLRYRGYYYDSETGFYYLQSRYYDPATRRFINADVYASTDSKNPISCNMFAYCENSPLIHYDENGELLIELVIIGIGVSFAVGGAEAYVSARSSGASVGESMVQAGIGALSAGLTTAIASIPGIGAPALIGIAGGIGVVSSAASEAVHYGFNKDKPGYQFDLAESLVHVAVGGAGNAVSGALAAGINKVVDGQGAQTFVGSVFSTGYTGVFFGVKKLIDKIA